MASAHVCLATRKSKILMLSVPVAVRVVQALETHFPEETHWPRGSESFEVEDEAGVVDLEKSR